ncbi:MAG: hypothetical protein KDB27_11105 [Planctomycetales bacterium]|nr:hypothetical protein [Planctomycetales bacterium]
MKLDPKLYALAEPAAETAGDPRSANGATGSHAVGQQDDSDELQSGSEADNGLSIGAQSGDLEEQRTPPIGILMPELARYEEQLKDAHTEWDKYGIVSPKLRRSMPGLAARSLEIMRLIQSNPEANANTKRNSRMGALSVAYYAAEMNPEATEIFREVSDEALTACTAKIDEARTTVLRLLVLLDYDSPDRDVFFQKLDAYSDRYDSDSDAIFLYKSVAKKLELKNHHQLSNEVLQSGIRRYRKNSRVTRLINDLIAQGGQVPSS